MEFKEKNNTLIFCICGKAGSGKSLVGKYLYREYVNKKFKVIVSPYTKYLKNYIVEITGEKITENNKPRALLQQLSSKLIKGKLGYGDFFIRRQLEDISLYKYFFDVIIIPDVRFPDEIDVLKDKFDNVVSIGVKRSNYTNGLTDEENEDVTEVSLDSYDKYDYVLYNNEKERLELDVLNIIKNVEEKRKNNNE